MKSRKLSQEQQIFYHVRLGKTRKVVNYLEGEENPNKMRWSGWSLLHRAAEQGQTETCAVLLDGGANVNARTAMGWFTPLHCALGNGWIDTAEFLVDNGASLYALSKDKYNPVSYGIKRGYKELSLQFQDKMARLETLKIMKIKQDEDKRLAEKKAQREAFEKGPALDQEEISQLFAQTDITEICVEEDIPVPKTEDIDGSGSRGNSKSPSRQGSVDAGKSPSRSGSRGNSKSPSRQGSVDAGKSPSRSGSRGNNKSPSRQGSVDAGKSPSRSGSRGNNKSPSRQGRVNISVVS